MLKIRLLIISKLFVFEFRKKKAKKEKEKKKDTLSFIFDNTEK